MKEHYSFKDDEVKRIVERFGNSFYERVQWKLELFANKWSLDQFQLIPSYSSNLVFLCNSKQYGDAVLKLGPAKSKEFITELQALQDYNGQRFCQIYHADVEHAVMLQQRIVPGSTLREEGSLEKRLAVFCSIYHELHILPRSEEIYPTYIGWVNRITAYMSMQTEQEQLYLHMKRAQKLCALVAAEYGQTMLLHGDLHHDNILLGHDQHYMIIDPKGVLGDPVFDIARFILNEFDDEITPDLTDKINTIFQYLEQQLSIPQSVLRKLLYVETTMGACWFVEDGASAECLRGELAKVEFAESLLEEVQNVQS